MYRSILLFATLALTSLSLSAQNNRSSTGPDVNLVVTAEARHGANPSPVDREDVFVHEGVVRDNVTSWQPAQGDHAQLDLFLMIDDSASTELGTQLNDIRDFIDAQPATTRVGVAYMQNGTARIVQNLTADHAQAAKSVRLPLGVVGINASPYFSLSDLIKRWPTGSPRREVIMISDGIDPLYGMADTQDPYVARAIQDAQRAGIVVFAIYNPGAGYIGHIFWRNYWRQIFLSQLTDETGGQGYYIGFTGPAVDFGQFFAQINQRLGHQYLLSFIPKPEKKSGMQPIKLTTEVPSVDLIAASQVYVPASQ